MKHKSPPALHTTYVEKFSHDGRGIARIDGKTTFITGALPTETVTFHYTRRKSDFDEGRVVEILTPAVNRAEPPCPSYGLCGGCSLQHLTASAQIHIKQDLLLDALKRTAHVQPAMILPPLTSSTEHYRNKARLSVRYVEKKQATLVGFREKNNPRYITDIEHCAVLNHHVDAELLRLRHMLDNFSDPRSIAQIEVAAGDNEVGLILRNLTPLTHADEDQLRQFAHTSGFYIYLQPQGPDSVYLLFPEKASPYLTYSLPVHDISFQFYPTDFTQVNGSLNRQMIDHALALLELNSTDVVLDFFCGLGNFSLPMAKYCAKVTGVEGSQTMVERASMNAANNHLTNTTFYAANLDDAAALKRFTALRANKLLLDPPRTGALTIAKHMDWFNPERIVYVSCNPLTLARDIEVLVHQHGYQLQSAGVMDMFPHTAHVESIALLTK